MIPCFVLDCSMAMAWCCADEATTETESVQNRLASEAAVVPGHWFFEVTNTLAMAVKRKRIADTDSQQFIQLLSALDIRVDEEYSRRAFTEIYSLCRQHGLTSYDAAYLELVLRQKLPLASLDGPLRKVAAGFGVELLGM